LSFAAYLRALAPNNPKRNQANCLLKPDTTQTHTHTHRNTQPKKHKEKPQPYDSTDHIFCSAQLKQFFHSHAHNS
jgi:heme-binding NEAT domain protein